jgi:hypothetical protein
VLRALLGLEGEDTPDLDWEDTLAFAKNAGITGLLWGAASGLRFGSGDPEARDRLRQAAIRDAAQTTLTLHVFARLSRLLGEAGIESMALKGIAIVAVDPPTARWHVPTSTSSFTRPTSRRWTHPRGAGRRAREAARTPGGDAPHGAREARDGEPVANYVLGGVAVDLHFRPPASHRSSTRIRSGDAARPSRWRARAAACRA